jgi:RNA polymerase sigma-70 factor (ECF subfamily)
MGNSSTRGQRFAPRPAEATGRDSPADPEAARALADAERCQEEEQWILRCQAGDTTAFRGLVTRYENRAFWVAYRIVGNEEDARDIVQEAFVRVFRALPRFQLGKRFYTWFYQIVLHLAIDGLRKRREQVPMNVEAVEELSDSRPEPLEQLSREEFGERVQVLLERLPARERAILVLRDIEGFSGKEISEIVDSNHATVRWWLYLARKQFRREWERLYGGENPCS